MGNIILNVRAAQVFVPEVPVVCYIVALFWLLREKVPSVTLSGTDSMRPPVQGAVRAVGSPRHSRWLAEEVLQ